MACDARHPKYLVECFLNDESHEEHFSEINGGKIHWVNDDYIPPADLKKIARQMAPVTEQSRRRNVGRSSVTNATPEERMAGARVATRAMEPEFVEKAILGGYEILRKQDRMTTDHLWNWCDDHGIFTEHPKGMTGLLRRLIREGAMEPVPKSEPDAYRPSTRTNESRQVRVYRSLIRESQN